MIPNRDLNWVRTRNRHYQPPYDEAAAAAVAPIEKAGKLALARARVHEVRCPAQPNGHRLIEVIRTRRGLVVRGKGQFAYIRTDEYGGDSVPGPDGDWIRQDWETEKVHVVVKHRDADLCVFLDYSLPAGGTAAYTVQCRCRSALVFGITLMEYIKAGRRKSIHTTEHVRAGWPYEAL